MTCRTRGVVMVAALCLPCFACSEPEDLGVRTDIFGSVAVIAKRTANAPTTPFIDTDKVVARVTMGSCLTDFYNANPEWAPDGEKGSKVADAWIEHVCDRHEFPDVFKCAVTAQNYTPGGGGSGAVLELEFDAVNWNVEGFDVRLGPVAREEHAGCEPSVTVSAASLEGYTAGTLVWDVDAAESADRWQNETTTTVTNAQTPPSIWLKRVP